MASQSFSFYERRAFWEVHGKRCAYCREPLSFATLEIDHIVPESLLDDAAKWETVRREYGLDASFDICSYLNLVPCCRLCNGRKSASLFAPGRIAIELALAARLADQVTTSVQRLKAAEDADKLRFALVASIESGQLNAQEIASLLSAATTSADTFRLSSIFRMCGNDSLREISKSQIAEYLATPVWLPPEMKGGLRLGSNGKGEILVSTLEQYRIAVSKGFFACSNFEMSVAFQEFERPLAILEILRRVRLPKMSFIEEPRVGLADIRLLPASLLFNTSDMTSDTAYADQKAALGGKSIQDLVSAGRATVERIGSDLLSIRYDGGFTFMFELMRADADADGIEDMLVHRGGGPIDGTHRSASVLILSRLSSDSMFGMATVDPLAGIRE